MIARLIRRWKVWWECSRLCRDHHDQGYHVGAYQKELYRAEAERRVP